MILDPTDQFIEEIARVIELDGRSILELGCGSGRITKDLAARCREVVAIDPDARALERARATVPGANVTFLRASAEALAAAGRPYDAAVFSLSLHHVPRTAMDASLAGAARAVRDGGRILVIEPGDDGTLIEAESTFDVGDGDERAVKAWAQEALRRLAGWETMETVRFRTLFHFDGVADFVEHLPPRAGAPAPGEELTRFLEAHRDGERIVLWAERRMTVLARS